MLMLRRAPSKVVFRAIPPPGDQDLTPGETAEHGAVSALCNAMFNLGVGCAEGAGAARGNGQLRVLAACCL